MLKRCVRMAGLSLVATGAIFSVGNAYCNDNSAIFGRPQFDVRVTPAPDNTAKTTNIPSTSSSQTNASGSKPVKHAPTSESGRTVERDFYRSGEAVAR